jgi:nucleotide-binding universal stress UspA family protein
MQAHEITTTSPHPATGTGPYRRVVIGIAADGSRAAIALGHALASADAVFVLVHIQEDTPTAASLPRPDEPEIATAEGVDLLVDARRALGQPCEIVVEGGPTFAGGLHRVAEREDADLIVIGAEVARLGRPGVEDVLSHAPCAVAIAGTGSERADGPLALTRVGIAYRPTTPGRHAADLARRIADAAGAELHAMTVVPVTPSPWLGPAVGTVQGLARLDGTLAEIAEADLEALGDVVDHVAEGDPVHELQRFSGTVDLLVVGTRSAGPLRRLRVGSTAMALATTASSALLVAGCDDEPADSPAPR